MEHKNLYQSVQRLKVVVVIVASLIVMASTFFANHLADTIAQEEKKRIEIWAEATRLLSITDIDDNMVNNLVLRIIEGNTTIPVIIDYKGNIDSRNVKVPSPDKAEEYYARCIEQFSEHHPPIVLNLLDDQLYIYYDDSLLIKKLQYFPYVQLTVIVVFILVVFVAFAGTKKAEQNRVWVGLSKETAHQLGTPISSLLAWSELLKTKYPDDNLLDEMSKDINRLRIIAERFSKIGSTPDLQPVDLCSALENAVQYVAKRTSRKVSMHCHCPGQKPLFAELNPPLFEWVIENICKNAIDAMNGEGHIDVQVQPREDDLIIDITDTGKGMEKKQYKAVFTPGYTTKKRGWGLGLSLAKRIIEEYHHGKIFVKHSEVNVGTTFRIILPASKH